MIGTKYLKNGFYSDKNNTLDKTIRNYADARSIKDLKNPDFIKIKEETQNIIARLMVESGLMEDGEDYINPEKEFFNESGDLDEKKVEDFKKKVIGAFAYQDINWTFAGTTSCYTKIMKKELEDKNIDYNDLLPVELKRKNKDDLDNKYKSNDPNKYKVYIYPNGNISTKYDSRKAKISFEDLKEKSGLDWAKGYSPDNKVEKNGWTAGFNSKGIWEKVKLSEEESKLILNKSASPTVIFTGKSEDNISNLEFLARSGKR